MAATVGTSVSRRIVGELVGSFVGRRVVGKIVGFEVDRGGGGSNTRKRFVLATTGYGGPTCSRRNA